MHCKHCHTDSDEPSDSESFKEAIDDIDNFGNRIDDGSLSEEELAEAMYAAADAYYPADDDEDEDEYIGNEEARVYHFVRDGEDITVTIEDPDTLRISKTGEHWVRVDDEDVTHVIAADFTNYEVFYRYGEE